jgi:hypothetical protein
MITTKDNPYDPFEDFYHWYMYDELKGYHSSAFLGRIAKTSNSFTDIEYQEAIEEAIDEIIKYDFQNIYLKVTKDLDDETSLPLNPNEEIVVEEELSKLVD